MEILPLRIWYLIYAEVFSLVTQSVRARQEHQRALRGHLKHFTLLALMKVVFEMTLTNYKGLKREKEEEPSLTFLCLRLYSSNDLSFKLVKRFQYSTWSWLFIFPSPFAVSNICPTSLFKTESDFKVGHYFDINYSMLECLIFSGWFLLLSCINNT